MLYLRDGRYSRNRIKGAIRYSGFIGTAKGGRKKISGIEIGTVLNELSSRRTI